jgi:hypothetical protein
MNIFDVLTLIGGLSLFLFGMNIMGQALERRAGDQHRELPGKLATNKLAEIAIKSLHGKAGGAVRELNVRNSSAVNGTRSRELWYVPTACGGRNAGKCLSDGLECTGGELHGTVEGADAGREPDGRLLDREFIEYTDGAEPLTGMDTDCMLKTLGSCKFLIGFLLIFCRW